MSAALWSFRWNRAHSLAARLVGHNVLQLLGNIRLNVGLAPGSELMLVTNSIFRACFESGARPVFAVAKFEDFVKDYPKMRDAPCVAAG